MDEELLNHRDIVKAVFFDDIVALEGRRRGFSARYKSEENNALAFNQEEERVHGISSIPGRRCTDVLYDMVLVARTLVKDKVKVVFTSTRTRAFGAFVDDNAFSRSVIRVDRYWKFPRTRVDTLMRFLGFYFPHFTNIPSLPSLPKYLEPLHDYTESRPGFFFKYFFSMVKDLFFF